MGQQFFLEAQMALDYALIQRDERLIEEARARLDDLRAIQDSPSSATTSGVPTFTEVRDLLEELESFVRQVYVAHEVKRLWSGPDPIDGQHRIASVLAIMTELMPTIHAQSEQHLKLARISMNSPLTTELLVTGVSGTGVVSTVVYLFKNPDKIGSWFPKLQTSWYNGRAEAEKAKKSYEKLRAARTKMRELQS